MKTLTAAGQIIAPLIDHTLLKPETVREQIRTLCREARDYGFAAVCVPPVWIEFAANELAGTAVKAGTVVGFPLGFVPARIKAFETTVAIKAGANEIDMVLAIGPLKEGDAATVLADMRAVISAAEGRTVKVILETCLLTDEEKRQACELAVEAGVSFVKTSTGLAGGGATVADVALMRRVVGTRCGVKASGGIRTLADAQAMSAAGATRIGTSAGVAIVTT